MDRNLARRLLAALARAMPVKSQAAYRALRFLYRRIPLPLERKMPWAQHLLADVPPLQQLAYRVARTHWPAWFVDGYTGGFGQNNPLLTPGRRILVVEHRLPTPDRNSSSVRLYGILRLLAESNWQITFVSNCMKTDYHWILSDIRRELPKYEQCMSALCIYCIYGMEALITHLKSEGRGYRFAILSSPEIMHLYAPLVRAFMPEAKLLYDTVDLHGLRFEREAATKNNAPSLFEKSKAYFEMEMANVECADTVLAVTDAERSEILRHVPGASVQVIPNIHSVSPGAVSLHGRDGLLFIGHYLHTPNEDAVMYFMEDILPLIREALPDLPFYVLGSSMTTDFKRHQSRTTRMIGYVEDPSSWFAKARVFVAPLRFGAGMKGKIGQSLALGLPVVTTSVGAEGMQLEHGKNVLIADSPADFASAVLSLYRDVALWYTLAENGKAHMDAHFSYSAVRKRLADLFQGDNEAAPSPSTS